VPEGIDPVEPPGPTSGVGDHCRDRLQRDNRSHVTSPPDPPIVAPSAGRWYRVWRVLRYLIGLAAVGAAIWAVTGKTNELRGATTYLSHMRWWWLAVAIGAEVASYLAYASLQRRLLLAGHIRVPMLPMTGVTLAGSAIQYSLPGGVVFYVAYIFRQYRRFQASDVLAGWTIIAVNALSFVTLAFVATIGLTLALSAGNTYDLVEAILGVVTLAILIVLAWTERARLLPHAARSIGLSQRVFHRPDPTRKPDAIINGWLDQVGAISPSRTDWAWAGTMAMSNWVADLGCLTFSFFAVGAGVPWRGLLLAYGAGQLATILPFTPGGLGVVEGSLTVALVTFGGGQDSTVAAVLLYRLISFWLLLPVGWGAWTAMLVAGRRTGNAAPEAIEKEAAKA
jgi:putative heme transporter